MYLGVPLRAQRPRELEVRVLRLGASVRVLGRGYPRIGTRLVPMYGSQPLFCLFSVDSLDMSILGLLLEAIDIPRDPGCAGYPLFQCRSGRLGMTI